MDQELLSLCLEQLNAARANAGVGKPLELDSIACRLAQEHAEGMAAEGFLGHVDVRTGLKPYQRYGLGGLVHHVLESVWGKDVPVDTELRLLVSQARTAIAERGESKPAVLNEYATHAGFGVCLNSGRFRYVEVVVTQVVELDAVSVPESLAVPELTLSGTVKTPGLGPYCALVYYDAPVGGTALGEQSIFYDDFGEERLHVAWPWDFDFSVEDGSFSTRLRFSCDDDNKLRSGTYYVQLFVKSDPASIPYGGEVEGVEIPGTETAPATGLVLKADAVPTTPHTLLESAGESSMSSVEKAASERAWALTREPDGEPFSALVVFMGPEPPTGFQHNRFADEGGKEEMVGIGYKRLALDEIDLTDEEAGELKVVVDLTLADADASVPEGYDALEPSIGDAGSRLCVCYAPAPEAVGLQAIVDVVVVVGASPDFALGAGYEQLRLPLDVPVFVCFKREGAGRAALDEASNRLNSACAYGDDDDDDELLNTELTPEEVREREEERARLQREADAKAEKEQREIEEARQLEEERAELRRLEVEKAELLATNAELQRKLAAVMAANKHQDAKKKDTESSALPPHQQQQRETAGQQHETEKQYSETLAGILETKRRAQQMQSDFDRKTYELQAKLDEKEFKAKKIADSFHEFKHEIAVSAEHSRTSKPIPPRIIAQFEDFERKREAEVEKVRLKNINLRMTLRKLEHTLRAKEQLAEGLHLIDFEQLKIENQSLNEKIEERNDELFRLKKKNTTNVQVLTHVKEKLQHILAENHVKRTELSQLDAHLAEARDTLTKSKADREVVRSKNVALKRNQGFANSDLLVNDFERRKVDIEQTQHAITELQERHAHLTALISARKSRAKPKDSKSDIDAAAKNTASPESPTQLDRIVNTLGSL